MINLRWFKFSNLFLLGLLIIGCSKDDDDNGTSESNEEQEQIIMDNAAKVEADIMAIFEKDKSPEEMSLHLDEIKAMESVEDAWKDYGSISVKIKNGGIISWYFFPENEGGGNAVSDIRKISANRTRAAEFALCEKKNSCIINTIPYDQSRECNNDLDYIANMLGEKGYGITNLVEGEAVTVDFLCKKLPNYGVSVLFTHGDYINGQHWIMTGTTYDSKERHDFYKRQAYADIWPELSFFLKDWQSNKVQLWVLNEIRNGQNVIVTYLAISETLIKEKMSKSFPSNSLMFAIACCTLKNNPSLWNVFKGKGLGCFFGYDDYVYPDTGIDGLYYLMDTMLEDFSTASEGYGIIKQGKVDNRSGAHLKYYPEGSNVCLMSLCPDNNHPHAIDLGIGTKWACCNVGASSPEGYGGYYAWGEIQEKSSYEVANYKYIDHEAWGEPCGEGFRKYYINIGTNIAGTQYDVASAKWGNGWKMPTSDQIRTLVSKCRYEWGTLNGIYGGLFTGPNGNSIFIPAAGNKGGYPYNAGSTGLYWSSIPYFNDYDNTYTGAYILTLDYNSGRSSFVDWRYAGMPVRAVKN